MNQQCIKCVPLMNDGEKDRLFWKYEESGNYSVKSAYRLIQV